MIGRTRRGQPLLALGLLLGGWVAVRAAVWEPPRPRVATEAAPALTWQIPAPPVSATPPAAALPQAAATVSPWPALAPSAGPAPIDQHQAAAPAAGLEPSPIAAPQSTVPLTPRVAAGHQLLWLAAVSQLPLPPEVAQRLATAPVQPPRAAPTRAARPPSRWTADDWLLLRPGGNGFNLPGAGLPGANLPSGAYGASQAGAVLRYRLVPESGHRPMLYLRASSALQRPRGEEAALGLALRPLPKVPLALMGEARITRTASGNVLRPAAALVSELPPQQLPLGVRGEAYVQAGWVGGKDHTAFVDGQARAEKSIANLGKFTLRAGGGAWGGAQRGASRLDLGPTATLAVPLGGANGRISADWRFRVAGDAAPGSGPALTLSAGF